MRKLSSYALILSALFLHSIALAEIPEEPTIAPLKKGQPAPWPGVLLNSSAVASIKFDKDTEKERIEAAVQRATSATLAQKNAELELLKVSLDSKISQKDALLEEKNEQLVIFREENKNLRDALSQAPNRTTWFGIGLVSGILVSLATVFAVSQASN
jgi:hypothetical protein